MEAVQTSITAAQFARTAAVASRDAAGTEAGQRVAGTTDETAPGGIDVPFTTLNVTVNNRFDEAILQIRDPQTGDVEQQIPSLDELETQKRLQSADSEGVQTTLQQSDTSSQSGQPESVSVRPGNSNESAQVQLNQNTGSGTSTGESRNADNGVAGQAVAALQAASNSSANTGGTGGGDQSAQVSVLA